MKSKISRNEKIFRCGYGHAIADVIFVFGLRNPPMQWNTFLSKPEFAKKILLFLADAMHNDNHSGFITDYLKFTKRQRVKK